MFDSLMKPVKAYRTAGEAFKDKDYACAVEKAYKQIIPWWVVPSWVAVICAAMLLLWVSASFNIYPIGG